MATVVAAPRSVPLASGPRTRRPPRRTVDTPTALAGLLGLDAALWVLAGTLGALEQCHRTVAHATEARHQRITLVERANALRPRTLL